jgi:hypothetical protein
MKIHYPLKVALTVFALNAMLMSDNEITPNTLLNINTNLLPDHEDTTSKTVDESQYCKANFEDF